jgi:hypothetical protein
MQAKESLGPLIDGMAFDFDIESRLDDMRECPARAAYPAKLKVDTWQIVVPTSTKISPICLPSDFQTRAEAEAWMESAEGRSLLAVVQRTGRIPTA